MTFAPGQQFQQLPVTLPHGKLMPRTCDYRLELSNPARATLATATAETTSVASIQVAMPPTATSVQPAALATPMLPGKLYPVVTLPTDPGVTLPGDPAADAPRAAGVMAASIVDETPMVSITNAWAEEGGTMTFTVSVANLSPTATCGFEICWDLHDGTAHGGGDDYSGANGHFSFSPGGDNTTTFTVAINPDQVDEPDEVFRVTLRDPYTAGVSFANSMAYGLIAGTTTDAPSRLAAVLEPVWRSHARSSTGLSTHSPRRTSRIRLLPRPRFPANPGQHRAPNNPTIAALHPAPSPAGRQPNTLCHNILRQ